MICSEHFIWESKYLVFLNLELSCLLVLCFIILLIILSLWNKTQFTLATSYPFWSDERKYSSCCTVSVESACLSSVVHCFAHSNFPSAGSLSDFFYFLIFLIVILLLVLKEVMVKSTEGAWKHRRNIVLKCIVDQNKNVVQRSGISTLKCYEAWEPSLVQWVECTGAVTGQNNVEKKMHATAANCLYFVPLNDTIWFSFFFFTCSLPPLLVYKQWSQSIKLHEFSEFTRQNIAVC